MREPSMKCFIEPRRPISQADQADQDDGDSAPGLTSLPDSLLQRHGAVVLNPATAAAIPGWPPPRPTVYRARTLLVPGDLLSEPELGRIKQRTGQGRHEAGCADHIPG